MRKPETDKLKENKESEPNQASGSDSGGNNDDTFTNKDVNLSAVEIKNEVCEDLFNISILLLRNSMRPNKSLYNHTSWTLLLTTIFSSH